MVGLQAFAIGVLCGLSYAMRTAAPFDEHPVDRVAIDAPHEHEGTVYHQYYVSTASGFEAAGFVKSVNGRWVI